MDLKDFVHLHLHTEYSILDGVSHINELGKYLKENGFKSCAITDHGVMYGVFEFYTVMKENGIKPIIGCEIYLSKGSHLRKDSKLDRKSYHMTIIAKNFKGYKNLMKIVSIGHTEGFYYKPRVDIDVLEKYSEGLICLSGCLNGIIPKNLLANREKQARKYITKFQQIFGKDNFYFEVQRNGIEDSDILTTKIEALAKELDIKIVATCDSHYIHKEDYIAQELLWCISDGKKLADKSHRTYPTQEFYVKTIPEMNELFKDKPEYIQCSSDIASLVEEYDIGFGRVEPVFYPIPKGDDASTLIRKKTLEGARKIYHELNDEILKRIDYELEVIHMKNYDNYILVVADYVNYAKEKGIIVGPGRGSGAGSIVAYCLGITNLIDPIEWNLPFERFLNPERPSPPDFDIDFEDQRRDEVVEYMKAKYGADRVSNIVTFGKLNTKLAIRDVARILGVDLITADKLSKLVPVHQGKSPKIFDAIKQVPEMQDIIDSNSIELNKLIELVHKIEGTVRHVSTHACGVLITPEPVVEYTPIQPEPKGKKENSYITQYPGAYIENLGLLKFDFLGLKNLSKLNNTVKLIKQIKGLDVDIDKIDFADQKVYKIFQEGDTLGVFQFESDGMKKYLKDLHPENIRELSFMAAAYRPGAMDYITPYIECKNGKRQVEYIHPDLEEVLKETYGYPIYQENIMEIARKMAGYSLGRADILRRAMGKKKIEILLKEKEAFISSVIGQGYSQDIADKLFEYLIPFSGYGFNKAHSASYAIIAYQTAYLKAYFYEEYMAVELESNLGDFSKVKNISEELELKNIKLKLPSINYSEKWFTVEKNDDDDKLSIRFGLDALKGINTKSVEEIIRARGNTKFKDISDFFYRIDTSLVTKKTIELLIKAGCMDEWGYTRASLLNVYSGIYDNILQVKKNLKSRENSLFDFSSDEEADNSSNKPNINIPQIQESKEVLKWERDILGIFISNHPMKYYSKLYNRKDIYKLNELYEKNNNTVKCIGIITSVKKIVTKKDGLPMAFMQFEDIFGKIEVVVFPKNYDENKEYLIENIPVIIKGKVSVIKDFNNKQSVKIFIEGIKPLEDKFMDTTYEVTQSHNNPDNVEGNKTKNISSNNSAQDKYNPLIITLDPQKEKIEKIKELVDRFPGDDILTIKVNGHNDITLERKVNREKISMYLKDI